MTTKGTHSRRNELAEALHKSDQSRWSQQEIVDCLCDNRSHILSHHTVQKKPQASEISHHNLSLTYVLLSKIELDTL